MEKKLRKSATDKKISGVCGGIGEFFGIDSTIVRLGWAALTVFFCGTGIIAYIIAALIIPEQDKIV